MVELYDSLAEQQAGQGSVAGLSPFQVGRVIIQCIEDDRLARERSESERRKAHIDKLKSAANRITFNDRD